MTPWPILSPSRDDGHACPDWCRLTSARCRAPRPQGEAADPETNARHEAEALVRRAARREALETRQREREAAAVARKAQHAQELAETRRLRAELSRRRQEARRAEPLTHEERSRRIREGMERARAEGRIPVKKPRAPRVYPRSPNRIPPEGMVPVIAAAKANGYNSNYLTRACKEGRLPAVQKGHYWYVREADVPAFRAQEAKKAREASQRNVVLARQAKAAKPWARLCPRKRKPA